MFVKLPALKVGVKALDKVNGRVVEVVLIRFRGVT